MRIGGGVVACPPSGAPSPIPQPALERAQAANPDGDLSVSLVPQGKRPPSGITQLDGNMMRSERLRGRKAVAQRLRRLRNEPVCRDCAQAGRDTIATVPDHIVPLAKGGTDDDHNIRCLCHDCHRVRTAEQFGYRNPISRVDDDGWPTEAQNARHTNILGGVPKSSKLRGGNRWGTNARDCADFRNGGQNEC